MFRNTFLASLVIASILTPPALADTLTLKSPDIAEGMQLDAAQVFQGFGCQGANLAPALMWSGAPEGTKSLAVTAYDPDAPTGSGWWHWFAFNIPADVVALPAGEALPKGTIELTNDYGTQGFGGACPPSGEMHRYQFTLHALDTRLELDSNVSNALAGFMVNAHTIASSTITAVFSR